MWHGDWLFRDPLAPKIKDFRTQNHAQVGAGVPVPCFPLYFQPYYWKDEQGSTSFKLQKVGYSTIFNLNGKNKRLAGVSCAVYIYF